VTNEGRTQDTHPRNLVFPLCMEQPIMPDKLYLIAHKVRGELAFDVAIKMFVKDDEFWWIIPTSGHRAYPFWNEVIDIKDPDSFPIMPEELRDHYAACDELKSRKRREPSTPAVPNLEDL